MKKFILVFAAIILCSYSLICQQTPDVDLLLIVSDNLGNSKELRYGLDALATADIDTCLGEMLLPPPPPSGAFDARFNLSELLNCDATWKDYRQGVIPYSGVKTHYIQHQSGGSTGSSITFEWNMPNEVTGILQDLFGGVIVNEPMSGVGSYTLTNLAVNPIKMIIIYDDVLPVELTYFTATLYGELVKLEWTTATEVNNFGFNIERKSSSAWQTIGFVRGNGNCNTTKHYCFIDENIFGVSYLQYRLKQIDNDGKFQYSGVVEVDLVPEKFDLVQNYPNPFNPVTTIIYKLVESGEVSLKIYDILGNEVVTLVKEVQTAGVHSVSFNGSELASGTYFCCIVFHSDNFQDIDLSRITKMLLVK